MAKFEVTIVSKDENFMMDIDSSGNMEVSKLVNDTNVSLTVIYNYAIDNFKKSNADFLILMHADVSVDMDSLLRHIEECGEKYDLMGLCGCEKLDTSKSPLNWFTGSQDHPESRWGCVTHGEIGNQTSFFSAYAPDATDHEVACVDGLCLILTRRAVMKGLRFNESLRFNCYDTQLCLDAILKMQMKVGCLVERSLVHNSIGKSILGRDFLVDEFEMRKSVGLNMATLKAAMEKFSEPGDIPIP